MTLPSIAHWFVQSPWMLFGLFSLFVPLIIHLLSKSKGKLVPFGNIKLIQLSKPVSMSEIRLVKRVLLLCRLLLLLLSILLIAQIYYDDSSNDGAINDNILMTNDWLNQATETELQTLALKAKTVPTYLISAETKRLTSNEIATWKKTEDHYLIEVEQQNTWLLVNNYAKTLPNTVNISVYSTNRLSQFLGDKIYLPDNITWEIKHLSEEDLTDSIDALKNTKLSVVIVNDNDSNEYTSYLQTALSMIKETKLVNVSFKFVKNKRFNVNNADTVDWILYIGSSPISAAVKQNVQAGSKLIAEIKHSKEIDITHVVNWRDLVHQIQFPNTLMLLLLDDSIQQYNMQQRLSDKQITSQLTIGKATTLTSSVYAKKLNNESINQLLIILLVFFWSIERVLSERFTRNEEVNKLNEENNSIPLTDSFTSLSDSERKA